MTPTYEEILRLNWEDQLQKVRKTLFSWSLRHLPTLSERAEVLRTFALLRVWYKAQILPLPTFWAKKIEAQVRSFLWLGQPHKNPLSLESVCLVKSRGGLGIPLLQAKCEALHLKQALRMVTSARNSRDHLGYWIGGNLGFLDFQDNYQHFTRRENRKRNYSPKVFKKTRLP